MEDHIGKLIIGSIAAILSIVLITGSFYTVDQGDLAVITRNGAVVDVTNPGFNWKMPFIDSVNKLSTREHTVNYKDVDVYSRDIQAAVTQWSVTFRVNPENVRDIYESYRTAENAVIVTLAPRFADRVRSVFGQYNAVNVIAQRNRLTTEATEMIRDAVSDSGIIVTSVQLENIDFSDQYEKSIEQRMMAEVEVERLRQNLEREKVQADIIRTQASAQADQVREQANAEAERIRLVGEAEATAISLRGEALQNNPELIQLITAEKWNGILPVTMIPNGTVPFLDVNNLNNK